MITEHIELIGDGALTTITQVCMIDETPVSCHSVIIGNDVTLYTRRLEAIEALTKTKEALSDDETELNAPKLTNGLLNGH